MTSISLIGKQKGEVMFDKKNSLVSNIREFGGILALFSVASLTVLMLSQTWVNY